MSVSRSQNFLDGLQASIKKNPIQATFVGLGLAWMFAGGHRLTAAAAFLGSGAQTAAGGLGRGVRLSANAGLDAVQTVGARSGSIAAGGASSLSSAASGLYGVAASSVDGVTSSMGRGVDSTRALGGVLQENLADTFERQPLLLGAVGIAVGAAIAAAFASTKTEKDMMGDTAQAAMSKAAGFVSTTKEQVTAAADRAVAAMTDEAKAQGLTSEALSEAKSSLVDRVKSVAVASTRQSDHTGETDFDRQDLPSA